MAEADKINPLKRWVRIMNKGNGYAGVFNYNNDVDKRIVEKSTIEEWRTAMAAEFGVQMGVPKPNPNDPPDFFVLISGQTLNVELVQLVEQEHKRRATKSETPFAGQLFLDMHWSRERFLSKLCRIITAKGEKYRQRELEIDVLLIHTAETWLTSTEAQTWLAGGNVDAHPSIRTVHLLFEYEPSRGGDHWPVVPVYGELPLNPNGGY